MPPGLIVSLGDGAALLDLSVNVGSQSLFVSQCRSCTVVPLGK